MRKSKTHIVDEMKELLNVTRQQRGDQPVNGERMKEMFGFTKDDMVLNDLNDWQLLQALLIEAHWALAQQGKETQMLRQVAGLNRAQRRNVARRAGR